MNQDHGRDHDQDRWLRDLGRVAREEIEAEDLRRFDRRWDAYAAGTLTPARRAALLDEARASAEGRRAAELFRPLDEDFKERLAGQTCAEVRAGMRPAEESSGETRRKSRLPEWLLGHGGAWRLQLAAVAAVAVVAALVGFRLLTGAGGTLPAFDVQVEPMSSRQRSGTDVFTPDAPLRIRLQPETASEIRPEVRLYVRREGRIERWTAAEEKVRLPGGGVIFVETPAWEFGPGDWTLSVVLGRRGTLPSDVELRAVLSRGSASPDEAEWQLLEEELVVEPAPGT